MTENKKKILLLERDLKDKQNTKEVYEKRIGEYELKIDRANAI